MHPVINNEDDMDLTPPSLSYSPCPSHQDLSNSPRTVEDNSGCCPSEVSSSQSYSSSSSLLDFASYKNISPYTSVYPSPVPDCFDGADAIPHLESMSQTAWSSHSPFTSSSPALSGTTAGMPTNMLSASHDHFGSFDSGLNGYGQDAYPPPPSASPAIAQMASPALSQHSRSSNHHTMRTSVDYNQGIKYSVGIAPSSTYPTSDILRPEYSPEPSFLGAHQASIGGDSPSMPWKMELEPNGIYSAPPLTSSPVPYMNRRAATSSGPQPGSQPMAGHQQLSAAPSKKRRTHTKKEEANFQCQVPGCGKFFSRSYNFKSHMETHDEKREYPFPCQEKNCTKKFVRKTDLQRHHQSVHAKERNHKCDYCGRMFARKDTLRRHMEDGCSRRFDIGTVALQAENFSGAGMVPRGSRPQSSTSAPPVTMVPHSAPAPRSVMPGGHI